MSLTTAAVADWLCRTLAAGGFVLAWAWVLMRLTSSVPNQRLIGSAALRIAVLVSVLTLTPAWLSLSNLWPASSEMRTAPNEIELGIVASASVPTPPTEMGEAELRRSSHFESTIEMALGTDSMPVGAAVASPRDVPRSDPPREDRLVFSPDIDGWRAAGAIYGVGSAVMALWWVTGLVGVGLMWRRSRVAPVSLQDLLRSVSGLRRCPQLRVVDGLTRPMCWGLGQAIIFLPARFLDFLPPQAWRWILSHESAHLRHADTGTLIWLGLAGILYYPLPWFWFVRRRLLLCQEHLADRATITDDESPAYAAMLLQLSQVAGRSRLPWSYSILGNSSDLYWRITMLLNRSRRDTHQQRGWAMLSLLSLLAVAVLVAGMGWNAGVSAAGPDDDKDQPNKSQPEPKKDPAPDAEPIKPQPGEKFVRPRDLRNLARPRLEENNFAEFEKRMQQWMEEMQKRFGQMQPGLGGFVFPNFPGFGNVPPQTPGRLGVMVEAPSDAMIEQLDLPEGQGLVVGEVIPDSPAAKAGLKPHDILLEFNGKPVPNNPQDFRAMVGDIKADTEVSAVVMRKGKRETIKGIKLPEVKSDPADPLAGGLIPLPKFPPAPAIIEGFGGAVAGGPGSRSLSIQISNNRFSVQSAEDNVSIRLSGKIEDGKRVVNDIEIVDGEEKHSYDNLDHVPEQYRGRIGELLKRISVKGK